ncbi:SgcJ/EcaC family oxidoreductase [Tsukamurella tyrosinosolvens]|uniref:SnoaL-like domain-containing protein n=1 Tax=Tsukamurella tyrosinosolvens TaxID=57704 RepID=A0A1H4RMC8_TSUTY|nr:SgcJ/EcaC family oxidoreductase [Tsukamurella tyrosinosolvens]KXO93682.1 hypothetical protein AXK58_17970 [Tsukamurella tyrosinosolvens]KXP05554.1 hypothetical protein AXK59_08395 [Tsukamurella tyrosinosolvens]KZL95372.1 hypothetical protein AXX05_19420 [Tsukamurella tyrosinosolvens]MCA4993881.1 SgcJ/EcaC family oxidoreductase [Tsukamurella tyrosinosolvens]QRY82833.1 SgcJ/EcaC family oxidoreductase [Tsukamurella tyrosinosolvens]
MPSAEDREQLEELERRQIASWGRDGAAFAATFTEDADLVDVMGGHYRGRASIEATMTEGFAGFMAGTRMSAPTERTVDFISADTAVVVTSGNCILRNDETRCRAEDLSIQTKVAVRVGGEWLFRTFQNTRVMS